MSSKKPPKPPITVRRYKKDLRRPAPGSEQPGSKSGQIISTRRSVKKIGASNKPESRRSSIPPANPNERALKERGERYEKQKRELDNLIKILRKISGREQLADILQLHSDSKLAILEGTRLSDKLKTEAVETWRILNESIDLDRSDKAGITLPSLNKLVRALEPKTRVDADFELTESPHLMRPEEVDRSLSAAESEALKGGGEVRGLDPNDKYVYQATTMGSRTATGLNGIRETIKLAAEAVSGMSEDQLAMVLLHYKILKTGTIRTHDTAGAAHTKITDIINDGRARKLSEGMIGVKLSRANVKQGINNTVKQGHDLAQKIILILKMMDQETEVAELLAAFVPSNELPELRQSIVKSMPAGPKRSKALKTVDEAIGKKKEKYEEPDLPAGLKEQLKK